jgi:hypothetical protein
VPPSLRKPAMLAAASIAVGIFGPLSLSIEGQAAHVMNVIFSAGWSWAALAFLVGMSGKSKLRSSGAGALSLIIAVLAYYLTEVVRGDFRQVDFSDHTGQTTYFDWGNFWSMTLLWWFFACLLGPILGLAGNLAINGPGRLAARLVVPIVAICELTNRNSVESSHQDSLVGTTWGVIRIVAILAVVALVVEAVIDVWRRRSAKQMQTP